MAQLVERVLGKDEVTGSNPVSSLDNNVCGSAMQWSAESKITAIAGTGQKRGRNENNGNGGNWEELRDSD